jgi:hypothetical protein
MFHCSKCSKRFLGFAAKISSVQKKSSKNAQFFKNPRLFQTVPIFYSAPEGKIKPQILHVSGTFEKFFLILILLIALALALEHGTSGT